MKLSNTLMSAAFGLSFGLAASGAFAQNYTAQMNDPQWHRYWDHMGKVQHQLDASLQSGAIDLRTAYALQKELDEVKIHSLWQRLDPNSSDHYPIWPHLRHVHQSLGGAWEREFDHD